MPILKKALRGVLDRLFSPRNQARWFGATPAVKSGQLALFMQYRQMVAQGHPPKLDETGMRVFSGTDDDGRLLFIFAVLGFKNRICIDIGSSDGLNSNCANLLLNFGFTGLLIDGDPANIAEARAYFSHHPDTALHPPACCAARVTVENIDRLISEAGLSGEIDLLSVDIDGNDFWIWKAVTQVQPRVVIIETHIEFGRRNIVVPYDPNYSYPGRHPQYHGASPAAMIELGRQKGYRLAGTNNYGFNFIFIRDDERHPALPEITLDEALRHPRNRSREALFAEIKDWDYTSA